MTAALQPFRQSLLQEEREEGTIEKYLRDAGRFLRWMGDEHPSDPAGWKENAIRPEESTREACWNSSARRLGL